MYKQAAIVKRTTVDTDTRRIVITIARGRKPKEVAEVNHETFIRNALKDKMGWLRREPAPAAIKAAAKEMAAHLIRRDKEVQKAKEAAEIAEKAKVIKAHNDFYETCAAIEAEAAELPNR